MTNEEANNSQKNITLPEASELRYELKLACEPYQLLHARNWIHLHPEGFRTAYPSRFVNNLYLDTAEQKSFYDNLAGIGSRNKLRLRWYGDLSRSNIVEPVLELKTKENMFGAKRRQKLSCTLNFKQQYSAILAQIQANVPLSWQLLLRVASYPTLINRYHRDYYVSPDGILRLTLDYSQLAYDQRLSGRPNLSRRTSFDESVVIEIKSGPEHYERLEHAMGYFPILRTRNSKYVQGLSSGQF